jgi:hypothetical protein
LLGYFVTLFQMGWCRDLVTHEDGWGSLDKAQAVSRWRVITEVQVQSQTSLHGLFGGQSDPRTSSSLSTSRVIIIPIMPHTRSLVCHRRYIIL